MNEKANFSLKLPRYYIRRAAARTGRNEYSRTRKLSIFETLELQRAIELSKSLDNKQKIQKTEEEIENREHISTELAKNNETFGCEGEDFKKQQNYEDNDYIINNNKKASHSIRFSEVLDEGSKRRKEELNLEMKEEVYQEMKEETVPQNYKMARILMYQRSGGSGR